MQDFIFTREDVVELQKVEKGKVKNGEKIDKLTKHLYLTYLIVGILAFTVGIAVSYKRLKKQD